MPIQPGDGTDPGPKLRPVGGVGYEVVGSALDPLNEGLSVVEGVTRRTGTSAKAGSSRRARQTSNPLMPGIITSRRIRSGSRLLASSSASGPFVAVVMWYPWPCKETDSASSAAGVSSRKGGREPRPLANTGAFHRDAAPVQFGHSTHQGKPQPRAGEFTI